jgi:predicted DNA binding CopG/RHH family protein
MKKKFPEWTSDEEAEAFVANADLREYDMSDMVPVRFELKPKDKTISLRLPEQLLKAVQEGAQQAKMPYQRFMRLLIEQGLHRLRS